MSLALQAVGAVFLFVTALDYLFVGWIIFGALACLAVCGGTWAWVRGARLWPAVSAWAAVPLWATGFGLVYIGLILALTVTLLALPWSGRQQTGVGHR